MNKKIIGAVLGAISLVSPAVVADQNDDQFEEILFGLCVNIFTLPGQGWDAQSLTQLNNLCLNVLQGGATPSSDYNSSSNIGSSGANGKTSSASAQAQVESIKDRLAELGEDEEYDEGGWGLLLAAQTGETEREDTVNETGYESDLQGIIVGGDYRFDDSLVTGFALGNTTDEAEFDGNSGELETSNQSLLFYVTYVPADGVFVDGYLGVASLDFESEREISFTGTPGSPVSFSGTARGDYDGDQTLLGLSAGYDWYRGDYSYGVFVAFDISETEIDAYDEDGSTGFEFSYDDQEIDSETTTLGFNLAYNIEQRWGALVPTFSISAVHQSEDDSRDFAFQPALVPAGVTTPTSETTIFTETDDPDRNYLLTSLGLVAALNNGTQIFATYEQMSSHDFLDVWSINIGVIMEVL